MVIAAGFFFDLGGMVLMIVLSSLSVGGLILAENAGLLPRPDYSVTVTQWIALTALFAAVGFWTYVAIESIRSTLRRAERENAERKRVELAFKLSDFSVQESAVPTFGIAPAARIIRVNRAACELLGHAEEGLKTLRIIDLDSRCTAEQWPTHWQELRACRRMRFETRQRHKSGRAIPIEVGLSWFEFAGQEYAFAFVRDITERRASENMLRLRAAALE